MLGFHLNFLHIYYILIIIVFTLHFTSREVKADMFFFVVAFYQIFGHQDIEEKHYYDAGCLHH